MHNTLKVGDIVQLSPPFGYFVVRDVDTSPMVLISAGIGMTPIKSFADAYSDRVQKIIHVDKQASDVPFFSHFQSQFGDKTSFIYSQGGRPSAAAIVAQAISNAAPNTKYYVCGPTGFMCNVAQELGKAGVASSNVVWEAFAPSLSCPV